MGGVTMSLREFFESAWDAVLGTLALVTRPQRYNGASHDYERGNLSGVLLASAARTATESSADQTNYNGSAVRVRIVVSASAATPSVVFSVEGKDAGGNYYTLLDSAAVVGAGTTVLLVAPWTSASANARAVDFLPRTWRVTATHADADSITYAVHYDTDC